MSQAQSLRRQEQLLTLLAHDGTLTVETLARQLAVSVWTVRRDLAKLESQGGLRRLHGRAEALAPAVDSQDWDENAPQNAVADNTEGKERIGRAVAGRIPPTAHVVLSGGSTTLKVARALKAIAYRGELVTNALDIATELADAPGLRVVCTGGEVQPRYRTLAGAVTERVLKLHFFDVAVIGVSGFALPQGFTVNSQVEAATLGLMVEHARTVIFVADQSKFGRVAFASLPADTPPQLLVTDHQPPTAYAHFLQKHQIQLVIA